MRLKTIWTIPAMTVRERSRQTREWAERKAAALLPRRVRYWATIQEVSRAASDWKGEVPAMPLDEILRRIDR